MKGKIIIKAEEKPNEEGHAQAIDIDMLITHASRTECIELVSGLADAFRFSEEDWLMLMFKHRTGKLPGVTDCEAITVPRTEEMIRQMEEEGL